MALLCQKLCQGFFQCLLPPAPAAVLAAPWGPPLSVVGAAVSAAAAAATAASGAAWRSSLVTIHTDNRQCVVGRGWGCWVVLETIFCRSLTLYIRPDAEPTNLIDQPKQKPRRGGGLRQINTCCKVPLYVNFFRWRPFELLSISLIFLRQPLSLFSVMKNFGCFNFEER